MRLCFYLSLMLLIVASAGCSGENHKIKAGSIVYSVDYPKHKNNAFLYNILPKETEVDFQDGVIRHDISQANLFNIMLIDCNQKKLEVYHQYGDDSYNISLSENELTEMQKKLPRYKILIKSDTRIIAGLTARKAIAVNQDLADERVELWYTEDLGIPNPNWYNPYHGVPGVLLEYTIEQFGIKMKYSAIKFTEKKVNQTAEKLSIPIKGSTLNYQEYSNKMVDIFQSFQ